MMDPYYQEVTYDLYYQGKFVGMFDKHNRHVLGIVVVVDGSDGVRRELNALPANWIWVDIRDG